MDNERESTSFKKCPVCEKVWETRNDFLDDSDIEIAGYQVHFEELSEGLFLFNHSCEGAISLRAALFRDLYDGPMFKKCLTGTDECPEYCLVKHELRPCPAKCECAFVREIIQLILYWPKVDSNAEGGKHK